MKTAVNKNDKIYYMSKYWNDYPKVKEYICKNFTGDKKKTWQEDFKERFAKKPFEKGLFINCGNGRVEREFIDKNIVNSAVAFDYSKNLLKTARSKKEKRDIYYFQADVNKVDFKENDFDLVVNVAGLHHVQYLNRLCLILARTLKKNGLMVSFDYIGPYRNQYPHRQWSLIKKINNSLPDNIKKEPLNRPHLPSMLVADPTEAIHSNLIIQTLRRYFYFLERHDTNGGIAYEILTHNKKLESVGTKRLNFYINKILYADEIYSKKKEVPTMFSYFITKPYKNSLKNKKRIKYYQTVENLREFISETFGGIYYFEDLLKLIKNQIKNILKFMLKLVFKKYAAKQAF